MAVSYRTFSLGHILMVPSLGAAIAIVHGVREGRHRGRFAPPPYEPFTWGVARHPLRSFAHGDSKRIDRVPFPRKRKWSEVAAIVDVL